MRGSAKGDLLVTADRLRIEYESSCDKLLFNRFRGQMRILRALRCMFVIALLTTGSCFAASTSSTQPTLQLHRNWMLQSSCQVKSTGEKISSTGFLTEGWHRAEVPTTVVAALVADKTYP